MQRHIECKKRNGVYLELLKPPGTPSVKYKILLYTEWHKKTGTFEKPNKNWRNPRKKNYRQKLNHYNLPF